MYEFYLLILNIVFCLACIKFNQSNYCFNEADNQVQVTLTLSQPLNVKFGVRIMLNQQNGKLYIFV